MPKSDEEELDDIRKNITQSVADLENELIELRENNDAIGVASVEKQLSLLERALDMITDVVIDDNVDQKELIDAALRIALKR